MESRGRPSPARNRTVRRARGRSPAPLLPPLGLALALAAPAGVFGQAPDTPAGTLTLTLRPVRDGGPDVTAIEVRSELDPGPGAGDLLHLSAPVDYPGVAGVADRVRDLDVRDARGPVPFRVEDDPPAPGGFPFFRHWRAERPVEYPVTISYRSPVQPPGGPNGPPFGIRPTAGGVSGAGASFLVLPRGEYDVRASVRWDLGDLAPGSVGITTFGDGDFELTGSAADFMQGWYLAGPANRYPEQGDRDGFSAAWLGDAPFDAEREMAWAAGLYRYLAGAFGYLDPPRYRVFMRILDAPPYGGGTALASSFMLSRGPAGTGDDDGSPRVTFAHEMIHMWVGGIEAPQGVSSWFSEGLTTHYTRLLPMRGGFDPVDEYGRSVNEAFRSYFTSASRNLSADSIARLGFGDEEIRHIPYLRGSFYFADLDAKIRAASGGARDLDAVLGDLSERREHGERFDHDAWTRTVVREIGPEARDRFEAVILRGETIVPASDAFGPCFERRPARLAAAGRDVEGFEWVRVPGIPDEVCRGG